MNDLDRQIRARIESFVDELTQLVRRAALEAVSEALGGLPAKAPGGRRRGAAAARKPKGGKRTAKDLERMAAQVLALVEKEPGRGVDALGRLLGASTKDLQLPMKKLVTAGALTTKGQKRATKYFPGTEKARAAFRS